MRFGDLQRHFELGLGRRGMPVRGEQDRRRKGHADGWVGPQHRLRDLLHPAPQRVFLHQRQRLFADALDQACRPGGIPRRQRRLHRFGEHPLRFVPTAGFTVQRLQLGLPQALPGVMLHGLSKQGVKAVPMAAAV